MAEHLMLAAARTLRAVAALLSISLRSVPEYNEWEPNRDVLDVKENKVDDTVVSKFDYLVNGLNQRRSVDTSGTAFPAAPSWVWDYDSLGQVVSADHSVNANDRAYQYDAIGNRKKSADSLNLPPADNYTANSRNQYTAVGTVIPDYDYDGNAIAYPLPVAPTTNSTLVWDAENRLLATSDGNSTRGSYLYDAQSRRIAKTVGESTTLFVYDGFNCIAEYSGSTSVSPTLQKTYLWGLDLSGTLQGAGGVGGLLAVSEISNSQISNYYPTYDGNGNVSEYLNPDGSVAAHFEYDPFGNTVVNTDSSNQFNYRFSTKPLDSETGLYYYNYRYYDPLTGRWPSRDPIGEKGGLNLYGFVRNNGSNQVDILGRECTQKDGSFKWIDELEIKEYVLTFEGVGAFGIGDGAVAFVSAKITWKGRAQVSCCCKNNKEKDAAGDITASATVTGDNSWIFAVMPNPGSPVSGLGIGDLVALLISNSGLFSLPPGLSDSGGNAVDVVNLIKEATPESMSWDNRGKNPCQALVD